MLSLKDQGKENIAYIFLLSRKKERTLIKHDSEIVETFNVFSSSFFMRRVTIIGYTGNMLPRKRTEKAKPTEGN